MSAGGTCSSANLQRLGWITRAEEIFRGEGVFRGIDAGPGTFCEEDTDSDPVFERAELLELFGFFQWRLLLFYKI